jgi:putative transposase
MPWRTQTVMDERARFVIEARNSFLSFSELCRRYGISRPTGYKWLQRYEREGLEGLADRSHRPGSCPHATPPKVVERILEIRKQRGWGARKLRAVIEREFGHAPSADTIHRVLDRHDLLTRKKPKRRRTHPGQPSPDMDRPNATWSADFKGQFRTLDGQLCYPLTIQDGYSRFLLDVKALPRPTLELTLRRFKSLFRTYGLPDRILTDNGLPFASNALGRLSQLSVYFVTLGITPEFIEPGKPQQNGRHERMHRTLKRETARPPRASLTAQQRHFNDFRHLYNDERPHEALGQRTPASLYRPSLRPFPNRRPEISYPDHFEIRLVSQDSTIRWKSQKVFVSHLLGRLEVGLEEVGDGLWSVFFGPMHLGWLDERDYRIMDVTGRKRRR